MTIQANISGDIWRVTLDDLPQPAPPAPSPGSRPKGLFVRPRDPDWPMQALVPKVQISRAQTHRGVRIVSICDVTVAHCFWADQPLPELSRAPSF